MKILYQSIVIVFVIVSLFIIKDDVKVLYDKAVLYVANNITPSMTKENIALQSDKIVNLAKSVITPGALRATNSSKYNLALNANLVKISAKGVIDMTNKNRLDNGNLPPLKENSKLDASAQIKLQDMFKQQYFEHISPDGVGVANLATKESYQYIIIGENLALGNFKDDKALLDAWMASPGHRANILNNRYTEIGVAVGHGMFEGQDTWLAVQHFGLPRSACPSIDEVLRGKITLEESDIKTMASDLATLKAQIDSGAVYEGMTTNEQATKYNQMVATYNQMILDVKQKVSDYNDQIRAFNNCLLNSTPK